MAKKSIRKLPKQLMSTRILKFILDDFSLFGSLPFYLLIIVGAFFMGEKRLSFRLGYCLLLSIIIIIIIKTVHYKDRPQKEEFTIFMEKVIASSFPSTHSMGVTIIGLLVCITYPFLWVIVSFGIIAIMVYLQRYISKKHFAIDIVGGIMIAFVEVIFVVKVF